jgi:hypothetical protein
MGLDNYIEFAMKSLLRNPIIDVLRAINISKILIQSNFIKRSVGYLPFQILLHFVYMLVMNFEYWFNIYYDCFGRQIC